MKRVWVTSAVTAALVLLAGFLLIGRERTILKDTLTVGFVLENDESTPYTYNFALAAEALREAYPGQLTIRTLSNVPESDSAGPLRELASNGCDLIFTNNYSPDMIEVAAEYPEVQFCQISYLERPPKEMPANYHTFKGRACECRYVSGIAAGMKLRELIDHHVISADEALVGYVAANPSAEVISGFTAFLLGVRSVAPEAVMRVRYVHSWGNFSREKACARALIDEGCVVLSQHSDTIAPAIACEEAAGAHRIYFVSYNQGMLDVAPTTALLCARINWSPYIVEAVGAMLADRSIEDWVQGDVNGNDMDAGFDRGWVEVTDLNRYIAADGTEERIAEAVEALKKGSLEIYSGDYTGINPLDPEDTCDLRTPFVEHRTYSSPAFHYVLKDVIAVEE